jgi:phospholipid/cholesterol/gamma-HCH transport system permease protein
MNEMIQYARARVFDFLSQLGSWWMLVVDTVVSLCTRRPYLRETLTQTYLIGTRSQVVVAFTGAFIGMVFCAQVFYQFHKVQMDGRVGASIAAELGTMRVTEQVDALRALAVHPVDYLVVPRMIALVVSLPLLTAQSILIGIAASYVVGVTILGVDGAYFVYQMEKYTKYKDVLAGLLKALVFGMIIVSVSCYKGLNCRQGAEGVGRATTEAVVISSVAILICNFFLTIIFSRLIAP